MAPRGDPSARASARRARRCRRSRGGHRSGHRDGRHRRDHRHGRGPRRVAVGGRSRAGQDVSACERTPCPGQTRRTAAPPNPGRRRGRRHGRTRWQGRAGG
ncbi:hypothetical protein ETD83_41615 [Actinomadura soli]|uniref:Uncharacterized protein n=1 Tax=Actinomadura soli TaxID=2508997 RepID=A0A5C4IZ69_9ACTN|nr:hypothetical protein ETD83_41615 [Actinomadura soli]